jgi:protein SCO1/2
MILTRVIFVVFLMVGLAISETQIGVQAADLPEYKRSVHDYSIPDVTLINQDGKKFKFRELTRQGKVVILDFIFGTCTTICPVLSASFVNFQNRLGLETSKVHLVSVSIDPEHDSPSVLREYLRKFRAKPGWDFYTGRKEDVESITNSFGAYTSDKMAHFPLTFVYSPVQRRWFRIDGLIATSQLMQEYEKALGR